MDTVPVVPSPGPAWLVLTASTRGAAHIATGLPNQDAVSTAQTGRGVIVAVADGHGHWRHLRSARGSKIAVTVGCEVGAELAGRIAPGADSEQAAELLKDFAVPAIIERWRAAVLADVEADPFSDSEQDQRPPGDDPAIAYGSTLLLAIAIGGRLLLAQIGDGDVVGVSADGQADLPVPPDPLLDGMVTTSLCGTDPEADFRVAVVDASPLVAVLLATDGYGNAQVVDDWPEAFSKDLAGLLRAHDAGWLADQLPAWSARCASADGSADDTTVALLIAPGNGFSPGAAEEETTIPAVLHSDTVTGGAAPPGPTEPITVRQPAVPAYDKTVVVEHGRTFFDDPPEQRG